MTFILKHQLKQLQFAYKLLTLLIMLLINMYTYGQQTKRQSIVNIIFTSDVHFGIRRPAFRGDSGVISNTVNSAMVEQMNTMPDFVLANDGGVNSTKTVGGIDYLIVTGDISNRMEIPTIRSL
jgi:hypothetical protein